MLLESSGTSEDVSKYEKSKVENIEVSVSGNSSYLSPEMMEAEEDTVEINPFKSDVFSLGIVLLEIGGVKNPLKKKEKNSVIWEQEIAKAFEVLEKNYNGKLKDESEWKLFTKYLNLTKECLIIKSDDRPDFIDLNFKLNITLIQDCDEMNILLDFNPNKTVSTLKTLLKEIIKIPKKLQRIYYNGKQLEDIQKLNSYNISNKSTLILVPLVNPNPPKPCKTLKVEDFIGWVPIGEGAYSSVYCCQNLAINNKSFAIKRIKEETIETEREIALWESLKKSVTPKAFPVYHMHYKKNSNNYLVFDLYPNSLATPLQEMRMNKREKPLNFQKLMNYWKSLVNALAFLQSSKICHRDIKPANILLDEKEEQVYLTDLGVSKSISSLLAESTAVGTPKYLSPELERAFGNNITQLVYDPFKSDVFSLGLVFLVLGTLVLPQQDKDEKNWVNNIQKQITNFAKIYEENLKNHSSSEKLQLAKFIEILGNCLKFEPSDRPDFIELFKKGLPEGESFRELILFQEKNDE